jgi:hypothetical protein
MSDLQDLIATQTVRAFNLGIDRERDRIIKLIQNTDVKIKKDGLIELIKRDLNA